MTGHQSDTTAMAIDMAAAMIEAIEPPAALLDDELRVIAANTRFLSVLSSDAPDIIGRDVAIPTGRHDQARLLQTLRASASAVTRCEIAADLAGGRRMLSIRASRVRSAPSEAGSLLLTFDDATASAATEAVKPPPTAERESATSVPARSRILAAATHDLRQPLQAMTLLGSLLARRISDPELLPLLQRLEDTITSMSSMLNTLLDINRWSAEATRAEPGNFVLADLFERLRGEFAETMRQRKMRWQVMPTHVSIHSDQRLLGQILRNMIGYAVQHSRDGRMLLGARRHGQRLRIELWDSGFEAADGDAQAIYDALRPPPGRGQTLNPTLTPGLSMVHRLADLLGHRIDMGFKPGRGSIFAIEVPLVTPAPQRSAVSHHNAAVSAVGTARTVGGTVFIIDDDPGVRETMRDLLDATGWLTEAFASCEAFLAADRPGRTGCILVDALLPGMSGMDLLRSLKEQRHRLPAIMLTGAGDVRMAVDAMAAGALNFIEKPVRFEELLPSIENAFDLLADSGKLSTLREEALARATSLTARQRQILDMVLAGQPSRNIAADLGVSRRTVENHRAIIMKKMGAASIPQLIRVGIAAS